MTRISKLLHERVEQAIARGLTDEQIIRQEVVSKSVIRRVREHLDVVSQAADSTHPDHRSKRDNT